MRLSRWRLLWANAQRPEMYRSRGQPGVYRWCYKHGLIEAVTGTWNTRITEKGMQSLQTANKEHARHGRPDPWSAWLASMRDRRADSLSK